MSAITNGQDQLNRHFKIFNFHVLHPLLVNHAYLLISNLYCLKSWYNIGDSYEEMHICAT